MSTFQKFRWNKKMLLAGFIVIGLELLLYHIQLSSMIHGLYDYYGSARKKVLTNRMALTVGEIILSSKVLPIFYLCFLTLCINPTLRFYQFYMGEKSIYTILRLPGKRSKIRFYYQLIRDSALYSTLLWALQILLLLYFYGTYRWAVPNGNQQTDLWKSMWSYTEIQRLYPFQEPWLLVPTLCMVLLIPATILLVGLTERSKKQGMLGMIGVIIGIAACYYLLIVGAFSVILVPLATLITVGIGLFYIYRKEIV